MIRIKMHAMYDHFPDHNPVEGEPFIDCYSDTYVEQCKGPGNNIALLLEPRSMIGPAYKYVAAHPDYFRYIFTHDSYLLNLPQSRMLNWSDVWLTTDSPKTKGISLVTSPKDWCPLHHARLELYNYFKDRPEVDCFYGDWNNSEIPNIQPQDYLENYKFSIIIENDLDDYWYTEKILNCFSTKTVPIYVGAGKIDEIFNGNGLIWADCEDIPFIVEDLDLDYAYEFRKEAIEDNFKRVEPWKTPWKERFFRDYGDLLEEMMNGK